MNMLLPGQFKIGAIPWTVAERDDEWRQSCGALGNCIADDQKINIVTEKRSRQDIARTFIHELLHALWYEYDLGESECSEEKTVTQLATGLSAVIGQNPHIMLYLGRLFDGNTNS